MTEPSVARDYDERGVRSVRSVLVELAQVLGAWRSNFVIVGGAVPWLLLPDADPSHIGTLDIDLDLDPDALSEGAYATLVEALVKAGYERGLPDLKPFQLRRWVTVDAGAPVAVLVDLLMPRDARGDRNRPVLIGGLRVQGADGADVALRHHAWWKIEGPMPDGRINQVELQVATLPALLVMKGFALVGRDKQKDAYDIYFAIRNSKGGPRQLAAQCAALMSDPVARKGYEHIASKFRRPDDFGPTTVRRFLEESSSLGEMTPEQIQMDAFGQVSAFLRELGLQA